jgi:BirA family transcriptional regulator, biotin operon repressor / biotin---[acetyl-CoA-carboxylase] ligase
MHKGDLLDPDKIRGGLNTRYVGSKIIVYKSTSSTNDIAAEYAKNKNNNGLTVFAEEQTAGRGRASNKWLTGKSDSLLCSVVLTGCVIKPELLSLACAVAVAEAIGNDAKIKWPNDIILSGKKIAGILLESKTYKTHTAYVIGIGINCHQTDLHPELQKTATSIDIETGSFTDRISLAKRLLTSLEHRLETAGQNTKEILDKWHQLSIQLHHRVSLIHNRRKFIGNCIGIDPEKGLILQLDAGLVRFFDAAHTTIAK